VVIEVKVVRFIEINFFNIKVFFLIFRKDHFIEIYVFQKNICPSMFSSILMVLLTLKMALYAYFVSFAQNGRELGGWKSEQITSGVS
jgi:hypothetical protein